jgi:hypothetical protein
MKIRVVISRFPLSLIRRSCIQTPGLKKSKQGYRIHCQIFIKSTATIRPVIQHISLQRKLYFLVFRSVLFVYKSGKGQKIPPSKIEMTSLKSFIQFNPFWFLGGYRVIFMTQSRLQCPICYSEMATQGPHQLTALKCGHLFGRQCLCEWIVAQGKQTCPVCRASAGQADMVPLIWDMKLPIDDSLTRSLIAENEKVLHEKQVIAKHVEFLESELLAAQGLLFGESGEGSQGESQFERPESLRRMYPGILFERSIDHGSRVALVGEALVYTSLRTNKYGINVAPVQEIWSSRFVGLHDTQIKDVAADPERRYSMVSVSFDKTACLTDLERLRVTARTSAAEPLWCCTWASRYTVLCGGARGLLSFIDWRVGRSDWPTIRTLHEAPVTSVTMLDENRGLLLTPVEGKYFDLRNHALEPDMRPIAGGTHIGNVPYLDLHVVNTRESVLFYKYKRNVRSLSCVRIEPGGDAAKPCVMHADDNIWCAFGTCGNNFALHSLDRIGVDIWKRWSNMYCSAGHATPILDLALLKEPENLVVFSASSDLLRATSIPL